MRLRIAMIVACLLAVQLPVLGQNIVSNGGFEEPSIGDGFGFGFKVFHQGEQVGHWLVDAENIDVVTDSGIFAFQQIQGRQAIDMSGSPGRGAISQNLVTEPGQLYTLRFALSGNAGVQTPAIKELDVFWGGSIVDHLTFDVTGRTLANLGWTYREYEVRATGDLTQLRFLSRTEGDGGALIDDVSVIPVPEPGAAALLLLPMLVARPPLPAVRRQRVGPTDH